MEHINKWWLLRPNGPARARAHSVELFEFEPSVLRNHISASELGKAINSCHRRQLSIGRPEQPFGGRTWQLP